jgi:hypothetical protein
MKAICACAFATALLTLPSSPMALEAENCPPEVAAAKTMLSKAAPTASKATARAQDTQASRQLAGARQQDIQAPRGQDVQAPRQQDVQAPRGQDVQAPRAQEIQAPKSQQEIQAPRAKQQDVQAPKQQDVQAPRGQDMQAPRGQDIQAPRLANARKLVREAEAACKKGDMALSASKAKEAMELLK